MVKETSEAFWKARAKQLARRINLAWFLQTLAGPLLILTALSAVAVIVIRREFPEIQPATLGVAFTTAFLILILAVLRLAWRHFETPAQALVRIEAAQNLDSSLSAAQAGVRPWPEKPKNLSESLRWNLPRTITPLLIALALLATGLLIPIEARDKSPASPSQQPQAWSEMDSQLEQLAEDAMVDEEYIEKMQERLDELRSQKEEQWFSHASLEATDSLKETQNSDINQLEEDLSELNNALKALTEGAKTLDAEQKQKLSEAFEDGLEGLQNGAMKPNPDLLDKLSKLDPNQLGKLSPEQVEELKKNMEKLKKSLENADGKKGEGEAGDWDEQLLGDQNDGDCQDGNCNGCKDGKCDKPGRGTGSGDIQRGPGHDPNVLRNQKDSLDTGELAALSAKDLSRATPGDLLQLQNGQHSIDEAPTATSAGGSGSQGQGGDRVWRESLDPAEQRTLKKYFE